MVKECTLMGASNSYWSVKNNFFVTLGSVFARVRRLPMRPVLHYEYFMLPCSLGIIQLAYHFLCRLLKGHRLSAPQ